MFGVINFTNTHRKGKYTIVIYPDLPSAISFFNDINQRNDDFKIIPHINKSLSLLTSQHHLYTLDEDLENYHFSSHSILNISIIRDEIFKSSIGSILLTLSPDDINSLKQYYDIETIVYSTEKCGICSSDFKIWDLNNNCGYYGCTYNPTYYKVITLNNLQDYHIFGCNDTFDAELNKLTFDKNKIFCVSLRGHFFGLSLAKIPLPDNWKDDMTICWKCMETLDKDFVHIWSH
jgi:hypothetical protein